MSALWFEQSKAESCVFRKVINSKVDMLVVVHVDGILAHTKDLAKMDRFMVDLAQELKLKDIGNGRYYMGYRITKTLQSARVES